MLGIQGQPLGRGIGDLEGQEIVGAGLGEERLQLGPGQPGREQQRAGDEDEQAGRSSHVRSLPVRWHDTAPRRPGPASPAPG